MGLWPSLSGLWVLTYPFIRVPYLSLSRLVCGTRLCELSVRACQCMQLIRARPFMSKGKCLKSSSMRIVGTYPLRSTVKGSSLRSTRARSFRSGGQLVNRNSREEPACLKYSEGLVLINSWSSSACVEGGARQ